jgi:hypothetical protein
MRSRASLAIVSAVVLGYVFLAPGSRPALAAPAPDPCSLLTPAQVTAAFGVTVPAGKQITPTFCQWESSGTSGVKRLTVVLEPESAFAPAKTPLPGIAKTSVTGVGDDAVSITVGKTCSLVVKKGTTVFTIRVYGVPLNEARDKEKALALEILKKL